MNGFTDIAKNEIDKLSGFIRSRIRSAEESEDILQEVFLAFYTRRNLGDMIQDTAAWLFRTASHKIVDAYRGRKRNALSLDSGRESSGEDSSDLWELMDASTATPAEEMERTELRQVFAAALEALPAEQRDVYVLHEIEGVSFKEMAERTRVPLNTLLSRKRYAVLRLREAIEAYLDGSGGCKEV